MRHFWGREQAADGLVLVLLLQAYSSYRIEVTVDDGARLSRGVDFRAVASRG